MRTTNKTPAWVYVVALVGAAILGLGTIAVSDYLRASKSEHNVIKTPEEKKSNKAIDIILGRNKATSKPNPAHEFKPTGDLAKDAAKRKEIQAFRYFDKGVEKMNQGRAESAHFWFREAVEYGHVEALTQLGIIWFYDQLPPRDSSYERKYEHNGMSNKSIAFKYWRQAERMGSKQAKQLLKKHSR